ncbi:MAG: thiol oxidoreductase [Candidatus Latescibacteria bacterium]|nr:thiol oxidoreductase [Candidatus Latescibacterota bacterium]
MKLPGRIRRAIGVLLLVSACGSEETISPVPDETRPLSGGQATVFDASSQAFEMPIPTLSANELDMFLAGDATFEQVFVTPPAEVNPGAGPVFSHTSCVGCHLRDGRGRGAFGAEPPFVGSMLMRVSLPGYSAHGGPAPVPGFGVQLGDRANYGVEPEARVQVSFFETVEKLADGEAVYLKHPVYYIVEPYQPLPAGVLLSARMAPPVFGRGLLEAISESDILALSDPSDADGDGISGRPNYVHNFRTGRTELGRFGLKANNPDILQQVASAYNEDMGVTSPYFPRESVWGQPQHDGRDDDPEITRETLDITTFYIQTLAVPARRNWDDPQVVRGEILFESTGCAGCHTTTFRTGSHEIPSLSGQIIHPYTDLLLHDMGEALADHRPDFDATGREWKTPALWGLGLTETVNGSPPGFLHDGRAATLLEAIMFHGGEAERSREAVRRLSTENREALLSFLRSL